MFNKLLSAILLIAIALVGFFMYREQDIGQLSIAFGDFSLDTNLVVVLVVALVTLYLVLMVRSIIDWFADGVSYFGSKRQQRLTERAAQAMIEGLIELSEGHYSQAEKLLLTEIKHNDNALVAYLAAARAAQHQRADKRRDKYLRLAHERAPEADTAIRITRAELQLSHEQYEQALATLTTLNEDSPKHAHVLKLLATVYLHANDWHNLKRILPELKKQDALAEDDLAELESRIWMGLLDEITVSRNVDALIRFWNDIPKATRREPVVTAHYARALIKLEAGGEAEQVLRQYLDSNWNDDITALYSTIDVTADNRQLETAEGWLHQHPQNAHLLLALGNMCTNRSLWGKARNYYEASIAVEPMPENFLRLARLLEEHMGGEVAAQEYYRQGLHLMVGRFGESTEQLLQHENTLGKPGLGKPELKVVDNS